MNPTRRAGAPRTARLLRSAVWRAALCSWPRPPTRRRRPGPSSATLKDATGGRRAGSRRHRDHQGTQFFATDLHRSHRPVPRCRCCRRRLQARGHADGLQDLLADRHRHRGRPQRACRRDHRGRAASRRSSPSWRTRRSSTRRSSSLSRTVGQNEVLNLPLVNRDLYQLLSITGGVSSNDALELAGRAGAAHDHQRLRAAAQVGSVNFQLDGGNNTAGLRGTGNPAPNPEAIQEFRVITNSYAAEYGRYQARHRRRRHQVRHQPVPRRRVTSSSATRSLNAPRWAPPGVAVGEGPARPQPVRRGRRRPIAEGQDVLLRELLGPAPGGDVLPQHRGGADRARARRRLLAVGASSRAIRSRASPFPGGIIPSARFDRAALADPEPATSRCRTCRTTSSRSAAPTRSSTDEATLQARPPPRPQSHALAVSYFYQTGTDTQPLTANGNIPWVDRDFSWTQHNLNLARHLDA